jgi:propanol-preferring alcohol dehydrogenase
MRAHRLDHQAAIESNPLSLIELPDPVPSAGELRVRVRACGVCRTDLHVVEGDLRPKALPVTPGHQIVGIVDALGPGCTRFSIGERVGVAWLRWTCGACEFCGRGEENLCPRSRYTGWDADGGYAERAVVLEAFAYALPAQFSDIEAAPLLCAGIIGYRALRRSRPPERGRVGIFGFGSSAHVTLQVARARGCEVYVSTRGERHRRLALELGATWVGGADERPPVTLDSAILFAPAGELVPGALRALRSGGTLALAGIHMSAVPALEYEPHLFHEKTITSVEANTRADGEELLAAAAAIPIRPRCEPIPFEEANRALQLVKEDAVGGTAVLVL